MDNTERQAHAAHQTFQKSVAAAAAAEVEPAHAPSELLHADSDEVVAELEALDDAVFDAIQGRADAMTELRLLWPRLKSLLGDPLLAESREQYIRFALSVWRGPAEVDGDIDPIRAVSALEVLCVLFDEV